MSIKNQNISDELVETYILHNGFEQKSGEIKIYTQRAREHCHALTAASSIDRRRRMGQECQVRGDRSFHVPAGFRGR